MDFLPPFFLMISGKQNSLIPLGPVIKCVFYTPRIKNIKKKLRKHDLPTAAVSKYEWQSTELFYQNDTITLFSPQLARNKNNIKVTLLSSNA